MGITLGGQREIPPVGVAWGKQKAEKCTRRQQNTPATGGTETKNILSHWMKYSGSGDTNEPQDIAEDIESAVNTNKAGSTTSSVMESYHTTASVMESYHTTPSGMESYHTTPSVCID